jgi:hypothetical protein
MSNIFISFRLLFIMVCISSVAFTSSISIFFPLNIKFLFSCSCSYPFSSPFLSSPSSLGASSFPSFFLIPNFIAINYEYKSDYFIRYSSLFFWYRASYSSSSLLLSSASNFSYLFLISFNSFSLFLQYTTISLCIRLALN